ncbi:hypothetical protein V6N11_068120 [Hibiscus sabdariffa]|uniref:Uncharacterized protein n=1 Tax=Hibiscus sabdariffa TaxID=183260 RepID=A0ABR2STQ6_9ROSI
MEGRITIRLRRLVNSKATVLFSRMINGEVHENIMWPDLPYATDEHGDVYQQVKSDEDVLQTLTVENNFVKRMSTNQSRDSDTSQAEKVEGYKVEDLGIINGRRNESELSRDSSTSEESEKNEISTNKSSLYKLEMIKIQLITAHGYQTDVELEDFKQAQLDAIAHAAAKIISRLKAGGETTTQALKSLCLRCKGIQVEEVAIISVDSLGFVLKVCCGTQIETLRFAFNSRATSEYSAERQLNDLLFPMSHQRPQKQKTSSSK